MEGGNLSLQVHPLKEYIKEKFGMTYTQDESYYMLDAKDNAFVYLGLKEHTDPDTMMKDLAAAQNDNILLKPTVRTKMAGTKHDHVSIPAGTVHCSGADSVVLEISATPYIFTFKLWDWGRMGLDGKPRPISLEHGKNVIQWDRTTAWTQKISLPLQNPLPKVKAGAKNVRDGCLVIY
jgi:mannose-6-phosphate isomerase class I